MLLYYVYKYILTFSLEIISVNQEVEVEAFKLPLVLFFHFLQYCNFKISKLTFNIPKVKSHFRLKPTDFFFLKETLFFRGT